MPKLFFQSRTDLIAVAVLYSWNKKWGEAESPVLAADMSWGPNSGASQGVTLLMVMLRVCMVDA